MLSVTILAICMFFLAGIMFNLWQMEVKRNRELDLDRERLLDRIRYLQDGPPRPYPGPPDTHEQPHLVPLPSFFINRKPDL